MAAERWAMLMGVRREMDREEVSTISKFLINQFGDLTLQDVTLAMELAAAGKLGLRDAEAYGSFNLPYVGKILAAYRTYLADALREAAKNETQVGVSHRLASADTGKYMFNSLINYVRQKGQLPLVWDWPAVYVYMEESGMVNEPDEEFTAIYRAAVSEWREAIKSHAKSKTDAIRNLNNDASKKSYAMKYYVIRKINLILNSDATTTRTEADRHQPPDSGGEGGAGVDPQPEDHTA